MKNYRIILFDLDGTLTDPGIGITNSVSYALNKFGIIPTSREELYKFIGPPLHLSFEKFYGLSRNEAFKAVEYYREYYNDKGIFENFIYDGIEELLKCLKQSGKCICLATSKPQVYAEKILEHFGLTQYFHYIAGANLDGTRTDKCEVIEYALSHCDAAGSSEAIMVGDREHDIIGAEKCLIDSIGVLFGYGDRNELEEAGATFIAENLGEVLSVLQGENICGLY